MQYLFEYCDKLKSPYEAFFYDSSCMPFPIRSHWHYFMEMILMVEGTGLIDCNGRTYVVEPGESDDLSLRSAACCLYSNQF